MTRACGKGGRLANIRLFEIREIGEQLLDRAPGGHGLNDHADGHTHAVDARLAAHDFRIRRDAVELLHVVIIAQAEVATDSAGTWEPGGLSFSGSPLPQRGPLVVGRGFIDRNRWSCRGRVSEPHIGSEEL